MLSHNYEFSSSFGTQEFLDCKTFKPPGPEGICKRNYNCSCLRLKKSDRQESVAQQFALNGNSSLLLRRIPVVDAEQQK